VAVRTEGLKGRGDGDLVGEQGDAEIAEEHPQGNQSTQTAESTRRGGHDHGALPSECGDRRLVGVVTARDPVDGILQSCGVGAVVFRRGDQESLMREEEILEALGVLRLSDLRLEILVKERHREITQLD